MISRRVGPSGLLSVTDEVLEVLYGTHLSRPVLAQVQRASVEGGRGEVTR